MACRASGRSTLRMSGTCTTRGMDSILLDTTTAGCGSRATLTAYSLPAPRPGHSLPGVMIMGIFGRYPVETTHDHEMPHPGARRYAPGARVPAARTPLAHCYRNCMQFPTA